MYVINREEVTEGDYIYILEHWSNGKVVKYIKNQLNPEPHEWEKDLIDEEYEAQLEQRMNIQYLVDLAEINMEEI